MATHEGDWPLVARYVASQEDAIAAYGVHPWKAHEAKEGWIDRLRGMLQSHPTALVGEIGLDKESLPPHPFAVPV